MAPVSLADFGANVTLFDFGFVEQFVIGDQVWLDRNGNGVQDANEPGIRDVAVQLRSVPDARGQQRVLARRVTDTSGAFLFRSLADSLSVGEAYELTIDSAQAAVRGKQPSPALAAAATGDAERDSNGVLDRNRAATTASSSGTDGEVGIVRARAPVVREVLVRARVPALSFGARERSFDFGFVDVLEIGDRVWLDENANGLREADEAALSGVRVSLLDASSGALLAAAVTNSSGQYVFSSALHGLVAEAPYALAVSLAQEALSGLQPSAATTTTTAAAVGGGTDVSRGTLAIGGGAVRIDARTPRFGQRDASFDFGFKRRIVLGDRVWLDENGNGAQDVDEPALANVTVRLARIEQAAASGGGTAARWWPKRLSTATARTVSTRWRSRWRRARRLT